MFEAYNSTEAYCHLGKVGMAEASKDCPWPYLPPLCEGTWLDYVGRPVASYSNALFLSFFGFSFVYSSIMQIWVFQKQRKARSGCSLERTGEAKKE